MKAIAFIKKSLEKFVQNFPQTRIRYEYNAAAVVHTIEVVPNDVFRLNEQYIAWENDFTDEFITQFPHQNIGFISDDALIGLDNVDFELKGKDYLCVNEPVVTVSVNQFHIGYISTSKGIINAGIVNAINIDTISVENANVVPNAVGILDCIQLSNPNYYQAA